jgi:hypothetical protein
VIDGSPLGLCHELTRFGPNLWPESTRRRFMKGTRAVLQLLLCSGARVTVCMELGLLGLSCTTRYSSKTRDEAEFASTENSSREICPKYRMRDLYPLGTTSSSPRATRCALPRAQNSHKDPVGGQCPLLLLEYRYSTPRETPEWAFIRVIRARDLRFICCNNALVTWCCVGIPPHVCIT